jgi:hypothetical protein
MMSYWTAGRVSVEPLAQAHDHRMPARAVRRHRHDHRVIVVALHWAVRHHLGDARRGLGRRDGGLGLARPGEDRDRIEQAGWEMVVDQLGADHAAGMALDLTKAVVVDAQRDEPPARQAEQHHSGDRDPGRMTGNPGADAGPQAGLPVLGLGDPDGAGPEGRPADDQQERGEECGLGEQGRDDAHGADGT